MERSVSTLSIFCLPEKTEVHAASLPLPPPVGGIIPFIQHAWQRTKGRSAADCLVLIPLRATEQFFQMRFQLLKCHFVQSSGLIFDTYLTRYLSQAIGSGR